MRLRVFVVVLAALTASCGGTVGEPGEVVDRAPVLALVADEPSDTTLGDETRPVWKGYADTTSMPSTLAAMTRGPVDVYDEPAGDEPKLTLEGTTVVGTTTVLAILSGPERGWVEVMLPVRPNGSSGWIRADEVSLYVADSEILIDLSDRKLKYVVDGVEVLETAVGIGSGHNETPSGRYFVTDNVTLADPGSPWGPHALGLSARSDSITEFNGGDGIIGIHGTNNPGSIGGSISMGCVRLPNDMITALHEMVPIGTRVTVSA